MNYTIRELSIDERNVLETFLYHAIYIPEGITPPPFEIINQPDLQVYIKDFGEQDGDICLLAECDSIIVGAVWVRIMNDYGHVSDDMPSLAISLLPEYRNKGIGTALMQSMQEIVSKPFLNHILLISGTDDKLVKSVIRILLHDMPKYGLPTYLKHGLRTLYIVLCYPGTETTGK